MPRKNGPPEIAALFNAGIRSVEVDALPEEFEASNPWYKAVVLHEMHHAHHISSTTVGCWLSMLDTIKAGTLLFYLNGCRERHRAVPYPPPLLIHPDLIADNDSGLKGNPITGRVLRNVWNSARSIEMVLMGEHDAALDPEKFFGAWRNVLNMLGYLSKFQNFSSTEELLRVVLSARIEALVPVWAVADPIQMLPVPIGARVISENASVVWTTNFPEEISSEVGIKYLLNTRPPDYTIFVLYIFQMYRGESWGAFSRTANAIFDLALMTPLWPTEKNLFSDSLRWEDLHPGHRLAKILNIVGRERIPAIYDIATDYVPFIRRICETAGWPEPRTIAKVLHATNIRRLAVVDLVNHLECFEFSCEFRAHVPWTIPYPIFWELLGRGTKRNESLDRVSGTTAITFKDGTCHIINPVGFRERVEIQAWLWIGHQLLEGEGIDLQHCDFAGQAPDLLDLARRRVVTLLETEPRNDGTGLGPLLSIRKYGPGSKRRAQESGK